jgi:hypothetical protein
VPLPGLRIFFPEVEAVLAGTKLAYHPFLTGTGRPAGGEASTRASRVNQKIDITPTSTIPSRTGVSLGSSSPAVMIPTSRTLSHDRAHCRPSRSPPTAPRVASTSAPAPSRSKPGMLDCITMPRVTAMASPRCAAA